MSAAAIAAPERLPTATSGEHATAWWGMLVLIATEATFFGALIFSYFYLALDKSAWPPAGLEPPELARPLIGTGLLLGSSLPMWWADRSAARGRLGRVAVALAVSMSMSTVFLLIQMLEYATKRFGPQANAYTSIFYVTTAFHSMHVFVALLMSAVVQLRVWLGHFTAERHLAVEILSMYWHFVGGVWIFIFAVLYLSPRLLQ